MVALRPHPELPRDETVPAGDCSPRSDRLKRAFDLLVSLALAVIATPLILVMWVAVRATSAGPGFYWQLRVGRNGRSFRIYKLRTMYYNCESSSGPAWSTRCDPRVTPLGRVLRAMHIDELPQLLNVVRGDMSIVGPRPERPEFVGPLSRVIPEYATRLAVRPGVTGLAQIQLPADSDVECVRQKLVLDRCYISTGSVWLDLRISLGTVVYLCGMPYAAVRKLMGLPHPLADQQTNEPACHAEPIDVTEDCSPNERVRVIAGPLP